MQKVLPGASRETMAFIAAHWLDLLKISAVPMAIYAAATWYQLEVFSGFYRMIAALGPDGQPDKAFFVAYMRNMAMMMVVGLLGSMMLGVVFTQIIRYQASGEVVWFPLTAPALKATGFTIAYALGMFLLAMFAYVGAAMAVLLPVAVIAAFSQSVALMALLMPLAIVAILAFLYWFLFRFLVGLPGVALGSVPEFFTDIWPLARGEGFGIPLRMMAATLVAYIPVIIVMAVFLYPIIGALLNDPALQGGTPDDARLLAFLAEVMDRMQGAMLILIVIHLPFIWFASLLLGTAFQRFRNRATPSTR